MAAHKDKIDQLETQHASKVITCNFSLELLFSHVPILLFCLYHYLVFDILQVCSSIVLFVYTHVFL